MLAGDVDSHLPSGSLGLPIFDRDESRCHRPTGLWFQIKMEHDCKAPLESSKEPVHLCKECLLSTPGPDPGSLATTRENGCVPVPWGWEDTSLVGTFMFLMPKNLGVVGS